MLIMRIYGTWETECWMLMLHNEKSYHLNLWDWLYGNKVATALEIRKSQGKCKGAKIVKEKSENLRKKRKKNQGKVREFKQLSKAEVSPFRRFNLVISLSIKMLYQVVREISL